MAPSEGRGVGRVLVALVPRCPACSRPMGCLQSVAGTTGSRRKRRRPPEVTYYCEHCNAQLTVPG